MLENTMKWEKMLTQAKKEIESLTKIYKPNPVHWLNSNFVNICSQESSDALPFRKHTLQGTKMKK